MHISPRRAAAALALALVPALALAGCSSDSAASAGPSTSAWSYTDDLGVTVSLDAAPQRVAGLNDAIVPLMDYGVEPVAAFGYTTLADDARFDDLDVSGVTSVGSSYGEIDLEKLAELDPDVIVTLAYPTDSAGTIDSSQPLWGFKDLEQQKQIEKIAPVITVVMGGDGADVIDTFAGLAESFGADPAVISDAKAGFDAASADLTAAAAKGLQVTAMYADGDGINVAKAGDDPALRLYRDLGVMFTEPDTDDYYWATTSWENATKIGGDVILLQQAGYSVDDLRAQMTFADNPALVANQVYPWLDAGMDYISQAAYIEQLAGWLDGASPVGTAS